MSEDITRSTKTHFSSVKKAREALKERAAEILEAYLALAAQASADKDFETAADILWKLLDHTPEDEDGNRVLESSVSKQVNSKNQGQIGPAIQIGIQLGGIGTPIKELPSAEVIDVSPINEPKTS
jgi:hypothetical protein